MNPRFAVLALLLFSLPSICFGESEEKSRPSFGLETDFVSQYVWRGIAYSDHPTLQPSAYAEFRGFEVSVWGSTPLQDEPNKGALHEIDYTLTYTRTFLENFETSWSTFVYTYPKTGDSPSTVELASHLCYHLNDFSFFLDSNLDVLEYRGAGFWDLGAAYERELSKTVSIETSALFGFGNAEFNRAYLSDVGFKANRFQFEAAFPWNAWKALTLTPHAAISTLLSSSLRRAVDEPTLFFGGIKVGVEF